MVQNYVHTREISIVVDDVGKCKEEVFYVNEATGDPKAEENLAPKARCGPRGFPVYTRIVFPGIPIHCILHTLVYLCILHSRVYSYHIMWHSVVFCSSVVLAVSKRAYSPNYLPLSPPLASSSSEDHNTVEKRLVIIVWRHYFQHHHLIPWMSFQ